MNDNKKNNKGKYYNKNNNYRKNNNTNKNKNYNSNYKKKEKVLNQDQSLNNSIITPKKIIELGPDISIEEIMVKRNFLERSRFNKERKTKKKAQSNFNLKEKLVERKNDINKDKDNNQEINNENVNEIPELKLKDNEKTNKTNIFERLLKKDKKEKLVETKSDINKDKDNNQEINNENVNEIPKPKLKDNEKTNKTNIFERLLKKDKKEKPVERKNDINKDKDNNQEINNENVNEIPEPKLKDNEKTNKISFFKQLIKADFPRGLSKEEKKKRIEYYLKESVAFTIIMIILDIIAYFISDDVVLLKLFDVQYLNIIVTIVISVLLLYIISFAFEYLIGEMGIKREHKKRQEGDIHRDFRAK